MVFYSLALHRAVGIAGWRAEPRSGLVAHEKRLPSHVAHAFDAQDGKADPAAAAFTFDESFWEDVSGADTSDSGSADTKQDQRPFFVEEDEDWVPDDEQETSQADEGVRSPGELSGAATVSHDESQRDPVIVGEVPPSTPSARSGDAAEGGNGRHPRSTSPATSVGDADAGSPKHRWQAWGPGTANVQHSEEKRSSMRPARQASFSLDDIPNPTGSALPDDLKALLAGTGTSQRAFRGQWGMNPSALASSSDSYDSDMDQTASSHSDEAGAPNHARDQPASASQKQSPAPGRWRQNFVKSTHAKASAYLSRLKSRPLDEGEVVMQKVIKRLAISGQLSALNKASSTGSSLAAHSSRMEASSEVRSAIVIACAAAPSIPKRAATWLQKTGERKGKDDSWKDSHSRLLGLVASESALLPYHKEVWRAQVSATCDDPVALRFLHKAAQEVIYVQLLSTCLRFVHSPDGVESVIRCVRKLLGVARQPQAVDRATALYHRVLFNNLRVCREPYQVVGIVSEMMQQFSQLPGEDRQFVELNKAILAVSDVRCVRALAEHLVATNALNPVNAATLLFTMRQAGIKLPEAEEYVPVVNALADRLIQAMLSLRPGAAPTYMKQVCANSAWALTKLGYRNQQFADALLAAFSSLPRFQSIELSLILWSFAMAGYSAPKAKLNALVDQMLLHPLKGGTEYISITFWSLARLKLRRSDFLLKGLDVVQAHLRTCGPLQAGNIIYALAVLGVKAPTEQVTSIVDAVFPKMQRMIQDGSVTLQMLSNTLWSLSKLGVDHVELTCLALRMCIKDGAVDHQVPHMSLSTLLHLAAKQYDLPGFCRLSPRELRAVCSFLQANIYEMDGLSVSTSMLSVAKLSVAMRVDCGAAMLRMLTALLERCPRRERSQSASRDFNGTSMALVLQAMALTGADVPRAMLTRWLEAYKPKIASEPQHFALLSTSLGKFAIYDAAAYEVAFRALLQRKAQANSTRERHEVLSSLMQLAHAAGTAGHRYDDESMHDIIQDILQTGSAHPFSLELLLKLINTCGAVESGRRDDLYALADMVLSHEEAGQMRFQAAAMLLYSLALRRVEHPALERFALDRIHELGMSADVSRVALYNTMMLWQAEGRDWTLPKRLRVPLRKLWLEQVDKAIPSVLQQQVYLLLKEAGCPVTLEALTEDGDLSIDIAIIEGGRSIAVEVDGPLHFTANAPKRELARTVARRRLLESRGWTVINIRHDDIQGLRPEARLEHIASLFEQKGCSIPCISPKR